MARPSRPARIFDEAGRPVLITIPCPRCRKLKPLSAFGLRRMDDGKIRNCPWCKRCRGSYPRPHRARRHLEVVRG